MEENNMDTKLNFILKEEKHPIYLRCAQLLLPSGNMVTIREQNGNDDDVISSFGNEAQDATVINRFIAGLIIKNTFPFAKTREKMSEKEILKVKLKDKYFILLASRIFSLGPVVLFEWDWKDGSGLKVPYEEDLSLYLWNYQEEFPEPGQPDYFEKRMTPYFGFDEDGRREITLQDGRKVRYKAMDGESENYILGLPVEQRTVNAALKARRLEVFEGSSWQLVVNFSGFNPRLMSEIRKDVNTYDEQFDGITEIENPKTGQPLNLSLLAIPDFFFPREI
jgi:hypothetical protein